jgi:hypothetical protein
MCDDCYQKSGGFLVFPKHEFSFRPLRGVDGTWLNGFADDFASLREYMDACLRPGKAPNSLKQFLSSNSTLLEQVLNGLKSLVPRPPDPTTDKILKASLEAVEKQITSTMRQLVEERRILQFVRKPSKLAKYLASTRKLDSTLAKLRKEREHLVKGTTDEGIEIRRHALARLKKDFKEWQCGRLEFTIDAPIRRVYWQLLKPSGDSWRDICSYFKRLSEANPRKYDMSRLQRIHDSFKPAFVYLGLASFEGYIVLCYPETEVAILECPEVGNALYLMPYHQWKFLSQMSKTELLVKHRTEIRRIIHSEGWFSEVTRMITGRGWPSNV